MPVSVICRKVLQAPTTPCAELVYTIVIHDPESPNMLHKDKLTKDEYAELIRLLEKAYIYDYVQGLKKP